MSDRITEPLPHDKPFSAKVEALAGFGIPVEEIAMVLALDEQDLQATYSTELKSGHIKANAKVAENLFRKATGDGRESVTAAIFWLKTRARWREVNTLEHSGVTNITVGWVSHDDALDQLS